ncbi:hypothetical protein [Candidatus Methylobacter oryzae]|uniref:Flagellar FliJ protein n=1 Tax=Candidatus Methylobacter oryzae TaxID=2497749 RepID=A0ABY3C5N2_9GAMM|nr:hypothetical protein [Candidatus Methylobacter oryzae]TRW89949.1 hypothetical protein EKO24_020215 [Candidatus Methylobacter oryzae]
MFQYTKKCSKALIGQDRQVAGLFANYQAALNKIDALEKSLTLKTQELNQSSEVQRLLKQGLEKCTASLAPLQAQLQDIAVSVDQLRQENKLLKLSNDKWLQRALKLEFEVLTVKDELTKITNERDLAKEMCEILQVRLMSAEKERYR